LFDGVLRHFQQYLNYIVNRQNTTEKTKD